MTEIASCAPRHRQGALPEGDRLDESIVERRKIRLRSSSGDLLEDLTPEVVVAFTRDRSTLQNRSRAVGPNVDEADCRGFDGDMPVNKIVVRNGQQLLAALRIEFDELMLRAEEGQNGAVFEAVFDQEMCTGDPFEPRNVQSVRRTPTQRPGKLLESERALALWKESRGDLRHDVVLIRHLLVVIFQ